MKLHNLFDVNWTESTAPLVYLDWSFTGTGHFAIFALIACAVLSAICFKAADNPWGSNIWLLPAVTTLAIAMWLSYEVITPETGENLVRMEQGTSVSDLIALSVGCVELKTDKQGYPVCSGGVSHGEKLPDSRMKELLAALRPLQQRLDDAGCYWVKGSMERTVSCSGESVTAQYFNGKPLFDVLQPTFGAGFQSCKAIMPEGEAGKARVYVGEGRLVYPHRKASGYDCPDHGGPLTPAELSRHLAKTAPSTPLGESADVVH